MLSQDAIQVDDHVTVVCEEELESGAMVTTVEELFSPSFPAGVSKAYKWLLVNLQSLPHFETVRATCCYALRQVNSRSRKAKKKKELKLFIRSSSTPALAGISLIIKDG